MLQRRITGAPMPGQHLGASWHICTMALIHITAGRFQQERRAGISLQSALYWSSSRWQRCAQERAASMVMAIFRDQRTDITVLDDRFARRALPGIISDVLVKA